MRVFLLDDHEVVRRGLADLLHAAGDIEMVAQLGLERRTQAAVLAARLLGDHRTATYV